MGKPFADFYVDDKAIKDTDFDWDVNLEDALWSDPMSLKYHNKQWGEPKASTLDFIRLLHPLLSKSKKVLDVGCGSGAATYEISKSYSQTKFCGIDSDLVLIDLANLHIKSLPAPNLTFKVGDMFDLDSETADGVISLQTLSWLSGYEKPISEIAMKISPAWIGLTGLFYPGEISATTIIHEHLRNRSINYNTYSLPRFSEYCDSLGYRISLATPFLFPFDLPPPANENFMQTYTLKSIEKSERIQISGPMLMNWMTIVLTRV